MSVWLTIPSARPPAEAEKCLAKWRVQGYKIALWCDSEEDQIAKMDGRGDGWAVSGEYPGYAKAVNLLIQGVMGLDPQAEWFVLGGDDTEPDTNHTSEEIARQCSEHFKTVHYPEWTSCKGRFTELNQTTSTFGIMQPTGDRWAKGSIDKIAGSPWIGREFARRMYQGNGPLWPEYTHNFVDQELQEVAIQYGVFQQRRDLIHLHRHFMRESDDLESNAVVNPTPPHLVKWTTREHWNEAKAIFTRRKALCFPGSEPIA